MCRCRNKENGGQGKARCSREASHEDSAEDPKTSRRKWSHAEDVALVNAMFEMVASGVATSEDARAPDDAFEDINDVHNSSNTSEPLAAPTEGLDATPLSPRTRTTTTNASGNQAKKKRNVSNDVYIGDQMVAAAQIMENEISKVTSVIRVEHDLRDSFINVMAEVHELTDVERAIYGSKIMGRVELMATFMTMQPESRLPWLNAMFN
ncbi:hypothetical protein Syun_001130 [Stephania yunnanensis]|uniref:Uncharacterized protein n=1 Tax=Stephania yunnanensis TaxID=152371 RepID=A0AAP0LG21_9MAGN